MKQINEEKLIYLTKELNRYHSQPENIDNFINKIKETYGSIPKLFN